MKTTLKISIFAALFVTPLLCGCGPSTSNTEVKKAQLEKLSQEAIPEVTRLVQRTRPDLKCVSATLIEESPDKYTGFAEISDGQQVKIKFIYDRTSGEGLISIE